MSKSIGKTTANLFSLGHLPAIAKVSASQFNYFYKLGTWLIEVGVSIKKGGNK